MDRYALLTNREVKMAVPILAKERCQYPAILVNKGFIIWPEGYSKYFLQSAGECFRSWFSKSWTVVELFFVQLILSEACNNQCYKYRLLQGWWARTTFIHELWRIVNERVSAANEWEKTLQLKQFSRKNGDTDTGEQFSRLLVHDVTVPNNLSYFIPASSQIMGFLAYCNLSSKSWKPCFSLSG